MALLMLMGVLAVFLGSLYLPVLQALVHLWWVDPNYSHGFLIPLIAGYLIWSRKDTLSKVSVQPSAWGVLIVSLGLLLMPMGRALDLFGAVGGALFVKGLSLILTCAGTVLWLLGKDGLTILAFPLAYLVFMLPLPVGVFNALTLPLQDYATMVTTSALQLVGIPILREGNLIYLPSVTLGVTEACSGIRSLLTLLAGAVALSYFTLTLWWQRVLLVASVIPIAVLTNAFRVSGTGLLAHFWGAEVAQGFFHSFSGLALLIVASCILCAEILFLATLPGEMAPNAEGGVRSAESGVRSAE
jgi:exosortase